jgi:GxxExxY protein
VGWSGELAALATRKGQGNPGNFNPDFEDGLLLKYEEIKEGIVQSYFAVYNALGHGFLERVYENALAIELRERGLKVQQQAPIPVPYKSQLIGEYYPDLLVEECVIVELKAAESLRNEHFAQLVNYLRATHTEVGLLLNFGPKPEVRRKLFFHKR